MAGKLYTINFVDPQKSLISLIPSAIDGPSGTTRHTDIDLLGMGHSLWGEAILENLVHIMENFACSEDLHTITLVDTGVNTVVVSGNAVPSFSIADIFEITGSDTNDNSWTVAGSSYDSGNDETTITVVEVLNASVTLGEAGHIGWPNKSLTFAPTNPIEGQVWYNQTRGQVYVYSEGTIASPETGHWRRVGGITISSTEPTNPSEGDLWWETASYLATDDEFGRNLQIYISSAWVRVVDNYLPRDGSKAMQGNIDMGSFRIENLADPDSADDAISLGYADSRFINAAGDTMSGILNMGANKIENLADPDSADDAVSLGYADSRYVNTAGDTMSGVLDLGSNKITGLANATLATDTDAVNVVSAKDITGAVAIGGTQSGITVSYDSGSKVLSFNVNDPIITIDGSVTGSATMTDLGNTTITTTTNHGHDVSEITNAPAITNNGTTYRDSSGDIIGYALQVVFGATTRYIPATSTACGCTCTCTCTCTCNCNHNKCAKV